jgi:hypothetical protein
VRLSGNWRPRQSRAHAASRFHLAAGLRGRRREESAQAFAPGLVVRFPAPAAALARQLSAMLMDPDQRTYSKSGLDPQTGA